MPPLLQSVAIVVTANVHNPSILNHDFLKANQIIGEDWGSPSEFVSVPPFSSITYAAKAIKISCQEERLQFHMLAQTAAQQVLAPLKECAARYVLTLPHVPYAAVGINSIWRFLPDGNALKWITESLLSPRLVAELGGPEEVELDLQLNAEAGWVPSVECSIVRPVSDTTDKPLCQFAVNYSHRIDSGVKQLVSSIQNLDDVLGMSEKTITKIIGQGK